MYKRPPITSSAPSPMRNILDSQFVAATHKNRDSKPSRLDSFRAAGRRLGSAPPPKLRVQVALGMVANVRSGRPRQGRLSNLGSKTADLAAFVISLASCIMRLMWWPQDIGALIGILFGAEA